MKRIATAVLIAAAVCIGGCGLSRATIEGHDFITDAVANFRVGIDEYHADDAERMKVVRKRLAAALVADVVAVASDEAKTAEVTEKFLLLLEAAEAAERVEETRYARLIGSLRAMGEVNDLLRDLAEIKLGLKSDTIEYINSLRKKVEHAANE